MTTWVFQTEVVKSSRSTNTIATAGVAWPCKIVRFQGSLLVAVDTDDALTVQNCVGLSREEQEHTVA